MKRRQREQGVALLLALGVLSLLLVSGLAFVTNALLAQKSAAAYRFRSQAHLLGKSSVNRVMMLMRYYLAQGDAEGIGDLHSMSNGTANGQPGDIPAQGENDQLTPAADSLLTATVDNTTRNAPTTPRWEYLWDNYDANGRRVQNNDPDENAKLIGRFAYWVLPGGTVNFSEVLRGNTDLTGPSSMSNWTRRRGFGIRELNISGTSYISNTRLNDLDNAFAAETFGNNLRNQDSLRSNDYTTFVSMFNAVPDLTLTERNVIRRFLPPSGSEEEVYFSVSGTYQKDTFNPHRAGNLTSYHRFDLTRTNWNSLNGAAANSDALVQTLLGLSVSPTERQSGDTVNDSTETTSNCIPALRRIHTDIGAYGTLENRRKQIAANLIDYCDTDSIATSDSTDWEVTAPNYTGNEKTPYINEIMISPSVGVIREESSSETDGVTQYTYEYNATIDLRLIAVELINLYENSFPNCDISIKGECDLQITADDQAPQTIKVAFDIPLTNTLGACTSTQGRYATKILYTEGSGTGITLSPAWGVTNTAPSSTQRTEPVKVKVNMTNLKIEKVHLKTNDGSVDFVKTLEAPLTASSEIPGSTSGTTSTVTAYPHAGFEVDDPRENLYQGSLTDESLMNWRKIEAAAAETDKNGTPMDSDTAPDAIASPFTFNAKNEFCNPTNAAATEDKDLETATEPEDISSAYIANEPMKTLVELGAIHRAAKWQTINLRTSRSTPATAVDHDINTAGDTYQQGDAWILDHVKLTPRVRVPHRLYINNPPGSGSPESHLLYAALFRGLVWNWDKHYHYEYSGSAIANTDAQTAGDVLAGRDVITNNGENLFFSRAEMVGFTSSANTTLWNVFGRISPATDAQAETVPALVSSLVSFFPRSPDPVTLILAAQSIRDVGTPAGFSMTKLRTDGSGNSDTATVKTGVFDYDGTTYFDEITGTSRFYVEIGIDSINNRVNLLRFEPLD